MRKKFLLVFLLSIALPAALFAFWKPAVETDVGVNLTHAVTFEDSVAFRTSGSSRVSVLLPNWSVGAWELGIPVSLISNTASLPYSGVRNLSFSELDAGFRVKWNLASFYSLALSLGAGYGLIRENESSYASLFASLSQVFEIDTYVALTQSFDLTYRSGMLDFRIMAGIALSLRGER